MSIHLLMIYHCIYLKFTIFRNNKKPFARDIVKRSPNFNSSMRKFNTDFFVLTIFLFSVHIEYREIKIIIYLYVHLNSIFGIIK